MMLWTLNDDVESNTALQYVYPQKTGFIDSGTCVKTSNNKILLYPVFISWYNGSIYQLLMELEGVFFAMDNIFQSEDIVQISGDDYLVIQNVFRTTYKDYLLMKME